MKLNIRDEKDYKWPLILACCLFLVRKTLFSIL